MPSRAIQRRELSLSTSMPSHLAYSRTSASRNPFASSALLQAYELLAEACGKFRALLHSAGRATGPSSVGSKSGGMSSSITTLDILLSPGVFI
jgi:hypothetical protein